MALKQESDQQFDELAIAAFSPEVQQHMRAFAKGLSHAEGVLRGYHEHAKPSFTGDRSDPLAAIRESARLVFALSWSKAVLFSRSIIQSVNCGNLLAASQSLRAYAEMVAALRFTMKQISPIVQRSTSSGTVTVEDLRVVQKHLDTILHGGRFNWKLYFEEGVPAVINRKKLKRTQEERKSFETGSLRIGNCISDWGKDEPAAEFIYDYLCDLVHPNKGSNLLLLVTTDDDRAAFDADGDHQLGRDIFQRIFPYAISMCMEGMIKTQPIFSLLGMSDDELVLH